MASSSLPPGPKHWFFGATLFAFRRDPLSFLQNCAREHGDVSYFKLGPQSVYLFNHPELVKDVLVTKNDSFMKGRALQRSKRLLGEGLLTSEGDVHRRQRRLAQPAFQRQRLPAYGTAMSEAWDSNDGGEAISFGSLNSDAQKLAKSKYSKAVLDAQSPTGWLYFEGISQTVVSSKRRRRSGCPGRMN